MLLSLTNFPSPSSFPIFLLCYVNLSIFRHLFLASRSPVFVSSRVHSKPEIRKKKRGRKGGRARGREREGKRERRSIEREGMMCARANRSCRLYLMLQTSERRLAFFYCRVGREECVWLKFQSRPLRLFGDERWSRGKKNRSTGDNNDESVRVGGKKRARRGRTRGRPDAFFASFHLRRVVETPS